MISVIIPVYNKGENIKNTIQSVLTQSYTDFELIIVNDGSTDESYEKIKNIKDSRIKIINQNNLGVSTARNNGIRNAKYNYIALLDGDDLWERSFLEEMNSFIRLYPEAALYGCAYSFHYSDSNITTPDLGIKVLFQGYIDYFVSALNNTLFTSSSVVFKKNDFVEIGEFDTKLTRGEDIDLWIRFALKKNVAFYNKPLAIYNLDGENRALNKRVSKDKCLIWNLVRYKQFELTNPDFKVFLDGWRLAHVHNYLNGVSTEVEEIKSLLRDIDLKYYSKLWTILMLSPKPFQPIIYRIWFSLRLKLKGLL